MSIPLKKLRVCVIVLGDIERSPRMKYHVQSLLKEGYDVDLIGYADSKPSQEFSNVQIKYLSTLPELNLPHMLQYIFKTLWQILSLLIALLSVRIPHYVLCQNPPAIPTLFVCYFYCKLMRSKFIIDWHNYAHTIMALSNSPNSAIVRCAKYIEFFFGRRSYANFCVTEAMKNDLAEKFGIRASVLYDRPAKIFQPINLEDKHSLYRKLCKEYLDFNPEISTDKIISNISEETILTHKIDNAIIVYKKHRPGIIVSSTSWTLDEDFNILYSALEEYEKTLLEDKNHYPNLICVVTGKGPLKAHFIEKVHNRNFVHIKIITPWLEPEDYPLLLASADIGVCLHYSSSGLDLPMKVVDMFGCGLPVCAINYKCLKELVVPGKNGYIFHNSSELCESIKKWFYDFPNNESVNRTRECFEQHLNEFRKNCWHDNWKQNALPLFY